MRCEMDKVIRIKCTVDGNKQYAYLFDADVPLDVAKAFYHTTMTLGAGFDNTNMGIFDNIHYAYDKDITLDAYKKLFKTFGIRF